MTSSTGARRAFAAVLAALAGLVVSCGVPEPGTERPIESDAVPYDLLSTVTPTSGQRSLRDARGRLALLDDQGRVVWRPRHIDPGSVTARAQQLLDLLVAGPSPQEQAMGLSSGLPGGLSLRVLSLDAGRLTLSVIVNDEATPGVRGSQWPLGIAQLVLTVTTIPGVESVLADRGGNPVDLPLPDGRLAGRAVTRDDYVSLLKGWNGPVRGEPMVTTSDG